MKKMPMTRLITMLSFRDLIDLVEELEGEKGFSGEEDDA